MTQQTLSRIALLATGNELTEGDILNTNGQHIARMLTEHEQAVGLHALASDSEEDIVTALNFLLQNHNIVIITGGLGPTSDDRTRYALSTVLKEELVLDEPTWQHIQARLKSFGFHVHPANRQQALFPKSARILPNENGTAAGCSVQLQGKTIYMLPGPPNECLTMFQKFLLPELTKNKPMTSKIKLSWYLLGAVESEIAALLDTAVKNYPVTTGYRIAYPYLEVKIYSTKHSQFDKMLLAINNLLKPYLVSTTNQTASELLKEYLKNFSGIISIRDNATYGHLAAALTTPDTREHLNFDPTKIDPQNLSIELTGLKEFWDKQPFSGQTKITLKFSQHNKEKTTEVMFPYRNERVLSYAVEHAALQILRYLTLL